MQAPNFYHVRQEYLDRQLLLDEIQDCDYAIVYLGERNSPNAAATIKQLRLASNHYRGRVPIFICSYQAEEYLNWFPGMTINYKYGDSCFCLVQRGVITEKYYTYLFKVAEVHDFMQHILPWNYHL